LKIVHAVPDGVVVPVAQDQDIRVDAGIAIELENVLPEGRVIPGSEIRALEKDFLDRDAL